jgi:putative thioredoxin
VQRLAGAAEPTEVERLLSLGDEASLTAALELEPANDAVIIAMAALLISSDRGEEATALLARIPETPEVRHLLALARTDTAEIGDVEATLAELLLTVKTDDDARQRFVDLLEVMGPGDPRVGEWRRRLSTALF